MNVGAKFKTVNEFREYVNQLSDKEIQTWKTQDWLKMYQNLDGILQTDDNFQVEALNFYSKQDDIPRNMTMFDYRSYFSNEIGNQTLEKLNKNFRFEKQDFDVLVDFATENGKALAKKDIDLSEINVLNEFVDYQIEEIGENVDRVTFDSTIYSHVKDKAKLEKLYEKVRTRIKSTDWKQMNFSNGKNRPRDEYSTEVLISNTLNSDEKLSTMAHECAHSYLQLRTNFQKSHYDRHGVIPNVNLSQSFYDLLRYNECYYICAHPDKDGNCNRRTSAGYCKQPIEKMAELIGVVTEHSFRQASRQISERNAAIFAKKIRICSNNSVVPEYTHYFDTNSYIRLSYNMESLGIKDEKEFCDKYMKDLPKDTVDKFKFGIIKNDNPHKSSILVCVPNGYKCGEDILKDYKNMCTFLMAKMQNFKNK